MHVWVDVYAVMDASEDEPAWRCPCFYLVTCEHNYSTNPLMN